MLKEESRYLLAAKLRATRSEVKDRMLDIDLLKIFKYDGVRWVVHGKRGGIAISR